MSVRSVTRGGDWTFGNGRGDYKKGSREIQQNVITRLRSFTSDWFLDTTEGIDWIQLLGERGTEAQIKREIERVTLQTSGVIAVSNIDIISRDSTRGVTIEISFTDVFNQTFDNVVTI
jgi:hypothetical protein